MPAQWALTPERRDGVQEIADGHPALLQNAGHLLYIPLRAGKPVLGDPKEFTDDFVQATEQYFRDVWTFSTEPEQMLTMLIALSNLQGRLQTKRRYDLGDIDTIFSQWARIRLFSHAKSSPRRRASSGRTRALAVSRDVRLGNRHWSNRAPGNTPHQTERIGGHTRVVVRNAA